MNTPLSDFLEKYSAENKIRFHMPGHKGRKLTGAEELDLTEVDGADLADGVITLNRLLVMGKLVPSGSEGRRAIEQGGVSVDGEKVTDVKALITKEQLEAGVLVKRGKKSFMKFVLKA